jgi:ATP-dependent Clp protease ATP-binding subunit ClpA
MLDNLSRRALRVVMEARLEAGKRGANSIDVNSLVIGLITEDQNPTSMNLNEQDARVKRVREMETKPLAVAFPAIAWIKRRTFFPSEVAAKLLVELNETLPKSNSVPGTAEIPTSPGFDHVLAAAENLRQELHQSKVEPLEMVAAALREPCEAARMLHEAGITEEKVFQAIRAEGDLEKRSSSPTP